MMDTKQKIEMVLGSPESLSHLALSHDWIKPSQSIQELAIAGEGNMNKVFRASIDQQTSLVFKQSLNCVAKYPEISAPIDRIVMEAAFYRTISAHKELTKHTPKILGFDESQKILCMQDLGIGKDLTSLYQDWNDADLNQLHQLLTWLGNLHDIRIDLDKHGHFKNSQMRQLNHEHIFKIPFQNDSGIELGTGLRAVSTQFAKDSRLVEAAKELGELYLDESESKENSLLHGDFYPGSWLSVSQNHVYIIDPEFCFLGPKEFDLGVLVAHLRMAKLDDDLIWSLINEYYSSQNIFSPALVHKFAGVEIIRRILGVAQLPLKLSEKEQIEILEEARRMLIS